LAANKSNYRKSNPLGTKTYSSTNLN